MSTALNSFARSPFGARVRSPLGAFKLDNTGTSIGRIIIGGLFTGKIAWYDENTSSFVFPSAPFATANSVRSILFYNNELYAAADDGNIYLYDEGADTWSTLGVLGDSPRRILELGGEVYTCCTSGVFKWNPSGGTWDVVGGFTADVRDIAIHNGVLWAIGSFTSPGRNLAYLSGGSWQDGSNATIPLAGTQMYTLYDDGITLYSYRTSGGAFVQDGVWYLNETGTPIWNRLTTNAGAAGEHTRMGKWNGNLYVAPSASNVLNKPNAPPSAATLIANSTGGPVRAIADDGATMIVGGSYTAISGVSGRVHAYNGSVFTRLGGAEVDNEVYEVYLRQ